MKKRTIDTFFTYLPTPVGTICIRGTATHITEVMFLDETPEGEDLPNSVVNEARQQLEEYFAKKRNEFDLPLLPEGTEFQHTVWNLLQKIPFSKTTSYAAIARQYGDIKAIRAIGLANGKNPIAIIIPCHRVIGSNGELVGYAGGLWRKKWLLEMESPVKQESLF
jgi:methylated-DNA-[protein]-cysteine S-methyltransferase